MDGLGLNYMIANVPIKRSELESELMRYICIPGQAVSYKIGERFFKEQRDLYLSRYPEKTINDYHEAVLKYGIVPLQVLKRYLEKIQI